MACRGHHGRPTSQLRFLSSACSPAHRFHVKYVLKSPMALAAQASHFHSRAADIATPNSQLAPRPPSRCLGPRLGWSGRVATCRVGRNVPRGPLGASFERPSAHETRLGWQQTSGGSHSSALLEIMFRQMMSQATRLAHTSSRCAGMLRLLARRRALRSVLSSLATRSSRLLSVLLAVREIANVLQY